MAISKCVGIDLGTTNSVIAMLAEDNKTIICRKDKAGRKTFPSVIVYDRKTNGVKAGQIAFHRRGTVPEPIVSIKSHMGDANYRVTTGPLTLSPVEVSAEILKEMKKSMEEYLHEMPEYADYVVDRAVITIPAYFASNAREATTKAGELAGLQVEFTLQEPTAASLYYCAKNGIDNGIFMVYDLGGGTFDVSIVRLDEGDAYVLGIAGNNYLGGDNFDDALAHHLLTELQNSEDGNDLEDMDINHDEEDRRRFTRLKLSAEVIKKALSSQDEYFESTDGIFEDKSGAKVNLAANVTRAEFEAMIRPMLDSTLEECHKALREAEEQHGVTLDMIDGVLLVGGSTHIPLVAEIIEQNFTSPTLPHHTKRPKPLIDEPDMAVGYGAAIAAASTHIATDAKVETKGKTISVKAAFKPGAGYGGISMVEGKLTAEGGDLPDGIYAKVQRAAGGCTKEFMLEADGSFTFTDLVSEEESEPYSCSFILGGLTILTAEFDAAPRASEPPVVLSRDYYVETLDELTGQVKMLKLMKKGTQLPCSQDYKLAVGENPYQVKLRFFEENTFLKEVTVTFEQAVPEGTPLSLSLSCDRSSRFTVRAESAGNVVDAMLEPSPAPSLPARDELDDAVAAARAQIAMIPEAGKRVVAEKTLNRLAPSCQTAMEEGDAYKAQELLSAIRILVQPSAPALVPDREKFEARVQEVMKLNENSKKGSDDIAADIRKSAASGYRAYENEDQAMLSRAVAELDELEKLLKDEPHQQQQQHPMWMICAAFAMRIMEYITKYQQDTTLPPAARREYDPHAVPDQRTCQSILQACQFRPDDEACAEHLQHIREMYPIWEKCMKLMEPGVSLPKAP